MQYAQLGTSNVKASRVAMGVMRMSMRSREEAAESVKTALDCGVNFFDSADIYGRGLSSQMLGTALRDNNVPREQVFLQTKVSIVPGERYDCSREHLMFALDGELTALGTDYVDFLLIHRPDPLVDLDELADTFAKMKATGKVHHVGVSNMNPWQVDLLQSTVQDHLDINQLQFGLGHTHPIAAGLHVNMGDDAAIDRDGGVIEHARLRHMTLQAWSPFQFGTFAGCFIGNADFPELNQALNEVADELGSTPTAVATAWILRHPAKMQVICGSMSPEHIRETCAGADVNLSREQWWKLYKAAGNDLP